VPNTGANAALFCSDQVMLYDGRVLAAGGTDYYNDSCVDWNATLPQPLPFTPGAAELEGIKNARIFNPSTNTWTQTDSMEYRALVPRHGHAARRRRLHRERRHAAGQAGLSRRADVLGPQRVPDRDLRHGVRKVVEQRHARRTLAAAVPAPASAPNGRAYYNAGGQAFNPFGQAYDELLWNIVSSYDPASKTWTDHAIAGFPVQLTPLGLQSIATDLNPTNPNAVVPLLAGLAGA
jgi:hypothetical protein